MTVAVAPPRVSCWSVVVGVIAAVTLAERAAADPRAVVELFTSQGCSSCPAADKVIGELARDPSVVAISLPIDYWDYLGWKDTLADARFSARQRAYSHMRGDREVYTPQAIINGTVPVVGSDRASIEDAATSTHANGQAMTVPVSISQANSALTVSVAEGHGPHAHGEVWVCAVSKSVPIRISRGENRGREVVYHNVVRNWLKVGDWTGQSGSWSVPLENIKRDGVDAAVVYVQNGSHDKPGPMLGAAFTALH
jgi:hypothetical protein